jgi:hypothetical protein
MGGPTARGILFNVELSAAVELGKEEGVRESGMSKKAIEKNLRKALLDDGPLARALFEYELEEHVDEYARSKQTDGDEYFFAVTEHSNDVAMLLIDKGDQLHVNEDARALLKKLWRAAYRRNLEVLIPQMVEELNAGYLFTAGVKVSAGGKKGHTTRR